MIGYVTLGTDDYEKSVKFYDELLKLLGATRLMESDEFIAWGTNMAEPAVSVMKTPADGNSATVGNGVMVALAVDSTDKVDEIHAKALELGGSDEGAPGARLGGSFYAGYFRDPFGNKLNAFHFSSGS